MVCTASQHVVVVSWHPHYRCDWSFMLSNYLDLRLYHICLFQLTVIVVEMELLRHVVYTLGIYCVKPKYPI